MSADAPLLSVLCITYNHEGYIAQALDSFLMQETRFPFEIVIGEDCSADGTLSVVESYQRRFPGIIRTVTSKSNVGVIENFRRTLKACRGRYIALCEGDDFWTDKQKLQIQVDFMDGNPDYVISYHDACAFDESAQCESPQLSGEHQCDATPDELINARPISTLTACFRNVLNEIPSEFDCVPILDLCLWSLLGSHGKGKYLGGIKPAAYRIHPGGVLSSQSEANKRRMTMHAYLCLARYYARLGDDKTSQGFMVKTILLGNSQLSLPGQVKLLASLVDGLFGSPLYSIRKFMIGK
jgi:glycosyltransferase involved in cell wall biosynthesis